MVEEVLFSIDQNPIIAGSVVSGRVIMRLDKSMSAERVEIIVEGKSKVYWEERGSQNQVRRYSSTRNHLNRIFTCWQTSPFQEEIPAGVYEFDFAFQIPANCPPTFIGTYGKVLYTCQLKITRSTFKFDKNFYYPITVFGGLVCAFPGGDLPQSVENESDGVSCCGWLCCCCLCSSGVMYGKATISKLAFAPGELCEIELFLKNGTRETIENFEVKLWRQAVNYAEGSSVTENWTLFEANQETLVCHPGKQQTHRSIVRVPMGEVTSFNADNIVVTHHIKVTVNYTGCCCSSFTITVPIVIIAMVPGSSSMLPSYSMVMDKNEMEQTDRPSNSANLPGNPEEQEEVDDVDFEKKR